MWPFKRKPKEPKQTRQCAQCGKAFLVPVKRIADSKSGLLFCSPKCSGAYQSAQKSVPNAQCRTCGKVFHRSPANFRESNTHAYCSKECYTEARKAGMAEVRRPLHTEHHRSCRHCGKSFTLKHSTRNYYQRQYCSDECERLSRKSTGVFARYFETRKRGGNCEICGIYEPDILEVHHKDRSRDNNRPENLLLICPNCHRRIHRSQKEE